LKLENDADEHFTKEVERSESCSKILTRSESEMSSFKYRKCGRCEGELEVKNPGRVSKQCPMCGMLVAGAGPSWRWQLYSHISRRHFSKELLAAYDTAESNLICKVCGKEENSFTGSNKRGQFTVHLGARHKFVENFINVEDLEKSAQVSPFSWKRKAEQYRTPAPVMSRMGPKKNSAVTAPEEPSTSSIAESLTTPSRKSLRVSLPRRKAQKFKKVREESTDTDEATDRSRMLKKTAKAKRKRPFKPGNWKCKYCGKSHKKSAVLQSHLMNQHFKEDCRDAIEVILRRTEGRCPLCPNKTWEQGSQPEWSVHLHFSRTHSIAADLTYNNDIRCEANIEKIMKKFFPEFPIIKNE